MQKLNLISLGHIPPTQSGNVERKSRPHVTRYNPNYRPKEDDIIMSDDEGAPVYIHKKGIAQRLQYIMLTQAPKAERNNKSGGKSVESIAPFSMKERQRSDNAGRSSMTFRRGPEKAYPEATAKLLEMKHQKKGGKEMPARNASFPGSYSGIQDHNQMEEKHSDANFQNMGVEAHTMAEAKSKKHESLANLEKMSAEELKKIYHAHKCSLRSMEKYLGVNRKKIGLTLHENGIETLRRAEAVSKSTANDYESLADLKSMSRKKLENIFRKNGCSTRSTAKALGVSKNTLRKYLQIKGIETPTHLEAMWRLQSNNYDALVYLENMPPEELEKIYRQNGFNVESMRKAFGISGQTMKKFLLKKEIIKS